ncbi:MAG: hypothetical protein ACTSRC_08700 [Candidatus Helarchaeota archaeon]
MLQFFVPRASFARRREKTEMARADYSIAWSAIKKDMEAIKEKTS